MSVVKINAIDVPEGHGPELEARFAKRAGAVDQQPGFEHFELLRPIEGETRYFVYTRWESEDAYQAWLNGQSFGASHGKPAGGGDKPGGSEKPAGERPVSTGASLLAFEVVDFG